MSPAEEVLFLKPGCRVMLDWNKSRKLKNGTRKFRGYERGSFACDFSSCWDHSSGQRNMDKEGQQRKGHWQIHTISSGTCLRNDLS